MNRPVFCVHRIVTVMLLGLAWVWFSAPVAAERTQHWIYAGQSNLTGFNGLREVVNGAHPDLVLKEIRSGIPGTPIQSWLKDDPWQDRPKTGWKILLDQLKKNPDADIAGMVWYQGESNTKEDAHRYEEHLTTLIANVRALVKKPKLPVIVVQLATCRRDNWGWAIVREAQRRVAMNDPNVEIVTGLDLPIRDNIVHLGNKGKAETGRRQGLAALRLVYGKKDVTHGPMFRRAFFGDAARQTVVLEFDDVKGKLQLQHGWRQGFAAVQGVALPDDIKNWKTNALPPMRDALIYPHHAQFMNDDKLLLAFKQPLSNDARIGFGMTPYSGIGAHRLWDMPINGLTDDTGIPSIAFAFAPITDTPKSFELPPITSPKRSEEKRFTLDEPFMVGINGVGRSSQGVLQPDEVAGPEQFRQAYWNIAGSGLEANLLDSRGRRTPIGIHTACWYASFTGTEDSPDLRLMGSYNRDRNSPQRIVGLKPNTKYDLVLYHNIVDHKVTSSHYAVGTPVEKNGRIRGINEQQTVTVKQPTGHPNAKNPLAFAKYIEATKANNYTGNYVVFRDVVSDKNGDIMVWPTETQKGGRCRFTAMQIIYGGAAE